jgi:hypothetical protein
MRVRRGSDAGSLPLDESQSFMLGRLVLYMDRLLARYCRLDFEILEALHWLMGPEIVETDLLPLLPMLNGGEKRRRFEREVEEDVRHSRGFAHLLDQALRKAGNDEEIGVADLLRGVMKKRLDQLHHPGVSDLEKSLGIFQQMFGLSDVETEICLFLFILSYQCAIQ